MNLNTLRTVIGAAAELGLEQVLLNLAYKTAIKLGLYSWVRYGTSLPSHIHAIDPTDGNCPHDALTSLLSPSAKTKILDRADKICLGYYEQFGVAGFPINLSPPNNKTHWADLEKGPIRNSQDQDIKLIWEPARFGWGLQLAQAFTLTHNPVYANFFQHKLHEFSVENPAGYGENWQSAQECAIRVINILFASHLFGNFPTLDWYKALPVIIETHAVRISQTLEYARSQNNNHYLSESVALITCARALPAHPKAGNWHKTGWQGVHWCLRNQFENDGEYVQHSTNYHRLVLQLLLWLRMVDPYGFGDEDLTIIRSATQWYANMADPTTGLAPNLGANDGAYIFPLSCLPFEDHRPVVQASLRTFFGACIPAGDWDDLRFWMGDTNTAEYPVFVRSQRSSIADGAWRLSLRAITYRNRPSHADHLHCDVWAHGKPIALDAGTFSYNLPSPWQNALADTQAHNTVTVDGLSQMDRISKFLFTKWSASSADINPDGSLTGTFHPTTKAKYTHQREISGSNGHFYVRDRVVSNSAGSPRRFRLHWLLSDLNWEWHIDSGITLTAQTGHTKYYISIEPSTPIFQYRITKAGTNLDGSLYAESIDGWYSPTYLQKIPAISIALEGMGTEYSFTTQFWAEHTQV